MMVLTGSRWRPWLLAAALLSGGSGTAVADGGSIGRLAASMCPITGINSARLNQYGQYYARQMQGVRGLTAPDMAPLQSFVTGCTRSFAPNQGKAVIDAIVDRLALRWVTLKFSVQTGLPQTAIVRLYDRMNNEQQAAIDDSGIGDAAVDLIEQTMNALLGRSLSDSEVDLLALGLKLQKKDPYGWLERETGVPYGDQGRPDCIDLTKPDSAAACARKNGWNSSQQTLAQSYATFGKEVRDRFKAVKAKLPESSGLPCDLADLNYAMEERAIAGVYSLAMRANMRRLGAFDHEAIDKTSQALTKACLVEFGNWAAKPESRVEWVAILKAIARRDQAQVDFDRAAGEI